MRYIKLLYKGKEYLKEKEINDILKKEKFYWLIDSDIENADIEIKNKTLIWHGGNYYCGKWYYGIFENGDFYGTWENGIFVGGNFKGKWCSGVKVKN